MKRNLSQNDLTCLSNILATARIYAWLASALKSKRYLAHSKSCILFYKSYKLECEKFNTDVIEYDFNCKTNDYKLKVA